MAHIQFFKVDGNEKRAYSFIKFVVELFKSTPTVCQIYEASIVLTIRTLHRPCNL